MATSYDVNLTIGSAIGFTQVYGTFVGPVPSIQTIKYLDSDIETTATGFSSAVKLLRVDAPEPYSFPQGTTSDYQTITMYNDGNSALTITGMSVLNREGIQSLFEFDPPDLFQFNESLNTTTTLTINPESSATMQLAYYSTVPGSYTHRIILFSNSNAGPYRFFTYQDVFTTSTYVFDDGSISTISTKPGQRTIHSYNFTPYVNLVLRPELEWPAIATITSATTDGWSVYSTGTNQFQILFESASVYNVNGVYTATISVIANGISNQVTSTVEIDIDWTKYAHYGSWRSAPSYDNSIIGVSYDKIDGRRTLTIGVGTGGVDGVVQDFVNNEADFANTGSLSYSGGELDPAYPYWANVYRIPLNETGDTTPRTYYSAALDFTGEYAYLAKEVEGTNYKDYFGDYESQGSMFIVEDDGRGNVTVHLTRLRELSDDENFNNTLKNLSRAFHYYSDVDVPSRYPTNNAGNLELSPFNAGGDYTASGTLTKLFLGFRRSGAVLTSIVDIPQ
jgi:hypothetical protein